MVNDGEIYNRGSLTGIEGGECSSVDYVEGVVGDDVLEGGSSGVSRSPQAELLLLVSPPKMSGRRFVLEKVNRLLRSWAGIGTVISKYAEQIMKAWSSSVTLMVVMSGELNWASRRQWL